MRLRKIFLLVLPLGIAAALFAAYRTAYAPAEPQNPTGVIAVFGGDTMLDRNVAAWNKDGGAALFEGVREIFSGADIAALNLEGTITENPSMARQDNRILRFTFEPQFAREALSPLKLSAASLANNHALDFYESGYKETRERLAGFGVAPFGHPNNASEFLYSKIEEKGKTFCFAGYNELYDPDTAGVEQKIRDLRGECWKIIVFAHWGEEYAPEPAQGQRREARAFIDAGADLIIGAHPHVTWPHEIYQGKAIFYSLGNFIFDQEFSSEVKRGLIVRAVFYDDKTSFTLIPVSIEHARTFALPAVDTFELP